MKLEMKSNFKFDEEGLCVYWLEGGADDASSVTLIFYYNEHFGYWMCDSRISRAQRWYNINEDFTYYLP